MREPKVCVSKKVTLKSLLQQHPSEPAVSDSPLCSCTNRLILHSVFCQELHRIAAVLWQFQTTDFKWHQSAASSTLLIINETLCYASIWLQPLTHFPCQQIKSCYSGCARLMDFWKLCAELLPVCVYA